MSESGYCRVLIVDDEILIRQGIKHFMNWEQEGFQIVGEASNGIEALRMIQELSPHIVITDIVMPLMDGEELTKEIKSKHPEIEVIVLSSFGEYQYVRSTFQSGVADYILKPKLDIQHLLAVLKLTAKRIPSLRPGDSGNYRLSGNRLLEMVLGGYESDYTAEDVQAAFPYPLFRLIAVGEARKSERGNEQGGLEGASPQTGLAEWLAKAADIEGWEGVFYELPAYGGSSIAVANGTADGMDLLQRWASARANDREGGVVAVTEAFRELNEVRGEYRDSLLKLLNYSFFLPEIRLIKKGQLPPLPEAPEPFHLNRFTETFKRGQFQTAFQSLRTHAAALASYYAGDVFEYKTFLGNLIFNMTVLLSNMEYDVKELDAAKYSYFKEIEQSQSASEALAIMERFIGEAEERIALKERDQGNDNMKKLLNYIQEHYAEPLTLSDMARHFHFNPSYLSSYFTAHNEEGFIDYLHKVRIGKAEEMLRAGDEPISEISGMVGYSDHSYFCKVFKKSTGFSPSRYRRQFRDQG
ncbi:response regulator [Paenibacillus sp. CAU 1782]